MKISNSKHNHRSTRNGIADGTYALRVTGSQKTGFRLGGEKNDVVQIFGQTYQKQTDAVAYGKEKFDKTAKKLVKSKTS